MRIDGQRCGSELISGTGSSWVSRCWRKLAPTKYAVCCHYIDNSRNRRGAGGWYGCRVPLSPVRSKLSNRTRPLLICVAKHTARRMLPLRSLVSVHPIPIVRAPADDVLAAYSPRCRIRTAHSGLNPSINPNRLLCQDRGNRHYPHSFITFERESYIRFVSVLLSPPFYNN